MALIHGGQLQQVAEQYNIPVDNWLDLSTGISPISYPIPPIPLEAWQQLPQYNSALITAAKQYYQCSDLVITNGSQAIIKALPELYRQQNSPTETNTNETHVNQTVFLPERGYKEHAHAWRQAGYTLHFYQNNLPALTELSVNSVLVIINPNNPTGTFFSTDIIKQYHEKIKQLNGLLVLDEAFIDVMPNNLSSANCLSADDLNINDLRSNDLISNDLKSNNVLVLRSFGKFFGLAGIRIGFLIASEYWCDKFRDLLGPWQVNGPAQIIAQQALSDTQWHNKQNQCLALLRKQQEALLWQVFSKDLVKNIQGCNLFLTLSFYENSHAKALYHLLCQQGVYCRLADEEDTLRFGITNEASFERLKKACTLATSQLPFDN